VRLLCPVLCCLGVLAASIMHDGRKGKRRFERPLILGNKTGDGAVGVHPFMELEGELTENDWNMAVVARKAEYV
jgi:hypothetical protein